jgi:FtsH-binding integral membrane protein
MKKLYSVLFVTFCTLAISASNAFAAVVLPEDVDLTGLETWVGAIVVALVVMFGIRKIVKTTNRT